MTNIVFMNSPTNSSNSNTTKLPKLDLLDTRVEVCLDIAGQGLRCGDRYLVTNFGREALVSLLYPYFFEDAFTVNAPQVTEFGEPFEPRDSFAVDIPMVTAIILQEPVIRRTYPAEDWLKFNVPTVTSIILQEPVVRYTYPPESAINVNKPIISAITLNDVTIRSTFPDNDRCKFSMPTVTSIILTG